LVGILAIAIAGWVGVLYWRSTHEARDASTHVGVSANLAERPGATPPGPAGQANRPAQRLADLPPDQRVEPGEILVSDPPRGFAAVAEGMGFAVVETTRLEQLGMEVVRLRIPRGSTVPDARRALNARFPGLTIDAHQIYQEQARDDYQSQTARPIAGWPPSTESCGAGVRMGQIDAPVDTSHPALKGQRVDFRSFHTPPRQPGPADHGTAIAAMLVGKPSWGGLLPGAELFAANIFEVNETGDVIGSGLGLLKAVDWMVEKQVEVVNLSVAGGDNQIVRKAFEKAREKGLILVAAAGNWGADAKPAYPAAYRDVIAVTALDRARNPYAKANHGSYIDFAAPGVQIYTAVPHGGRVMSGTSFATPYITVLLAVQIEAGAPRSPTALRDLLGPHAIDLGQPGKDDVFGWGLVNLWPRCPQ
jgi:subtilisin family serine protease